jgi:hypothetical protein
MDPRVLQQVVRSAGAGQGLGIGGCFGATSSRRERPMVFMARATAPMFPLREGSTRTKRMRASALSVFSVIMMQVLQNISRLSIFDR